MRDLDELFAGLAKSRFRSQFRLNAKDLQYLQTKGIETILSHADDFIGKRLAPAQPLNDGKQTPYRGHPVFVAQHATACCCRGCLEKWHKISRINILSAEEQDYVHRVIERWLLNNCINDAVGRKGRN